MVPGTNTKRNRIRLVILPSYDKTTTGLYNLYSAGQDTIKMYFRYRHRYRATNVPQIQY